MYHRWINLLVITGSLLTAHWAHCMYSTKT